MSRSLGQVVATERAIRQKDNAVGSEVKKLLAKEALTLGSVKDYLPDAGDNAPVADQLPTEYTEVQQKVEDGLKLAMKYSVAAMDVVATKDRTNTAAVADVIVDGEVFIPKVPISHLLWLENYLTEWRGFLAVLPVLNPSRKWDLDEGSGLYRARPEERPRTLKKVIPLVLHPGTDKHAPQATTTSEEVHVGTYVTTHLSGAITEQRKRQLLDKLDKVLLAVKDAIAVANRTTADEVHEGETILSYILG